MSNWSVDCLDIGWPLVLNDTPIPLMLNIYIIYEQCPLTVDDDGQDQQCGGWGTRLPLHMSSNSRRVRE